MAAQIAAAVAGLGGGNAAAVAAATKAAAMDDTVGVTPFSAFLSDPATGGAEPPRAIPTADGERVEYGVLANRNARAVSAGETTGSWTRDLLRGLATLAALDPAQAQLGQDFTDLVGTAREGLRSAAGALAVEQGALGQVEARLEAARVRHEEASAVLAGQLAAVEEVDMAETLTRLQATRSQLEASYRAIASLGGLTLAQFLR
jgi:flagellin-like hook-associated protein FlgL